MRFSTSPRLGISICVGMLLPVLAALPGRTPHRRYPVTVRLTLGTMLAQQSSIVPRASDTAARAFLLVSVLGPRGNTQIVHLPDDGHLSMFANEPLTRRPFVDVTFEPGDSARVLFSMLDAPIEQRAREMDAAAASIAALTQPTSDRAQIIGLALAPLASGGARWAGSLSLRMVNDGGTTYLRALDCVSTCKVVAGGATPAALMTSSSAILEMSGSTRGYQLHLDAQQLP